MDAVLDTHREREPIVTILKSLECPELNHSLAVSNLARRIAQEMSVFSDSTVEEIAYAGLIHDIGKTSVDESLLRSHDKLSEKEKMEMMSHALMGAALCPSEKIEVVRGVIGHHENWDGTGYPLGISGECIHPFARIIRAADIIDALLSVRPYKNGWTPKRTKKYLLKKRGTFIEPFIADVVADIWDELVAISRESHAQVLTEHRNAAKEKV